jgi:hypothetical protein
MCIFLINFLKHETKPKFNNQQSKYLGETITNTCEIQMRKYTCSAYPVYQIQVSCHLHSPVVLPQEPGYHSDIRWVSATVGQSILKQKWFLTLPGIKPKFHCRVARSLVKIPRKLSRLPRIRKFVFFYGFEKQVITSFILQDSGAWY